MALFKRKKNRDVGVDGAGASAYSSSRPAFNDLTVGDVSTGVPRIRVGEMLNSFKRQMFWLIPLLLLGTIGAWFLTSDFKRTYHADGSILVQLGSEYVYNPIGTDQTTAAGLTLTPDHIVLNEIALVKNSDNISRLISEMEAEFGARFAPDNFEKRSRLAKDSIEYNEAIVELRTAVDRNLGVSAKPKSSILVISYKHEDPEIAIAALNMVIDAYLDFRRSIFIEGSGEVLTERRVATETQLKSNSRAIASFLANNNISDFASERTGVTERTETLRETLNTLRADLIENERALGSVENQLRNTPAQIDLQVDDRASQRVAQAELELSQLLVKYLPTSEPVRRKQAEVDELNRLQSSFGGNARGGRRVGPNEVYQELSTRRNTLQSTADALREKEVLVQRQLDTADAKVRKLQTLSPAYSELLREQDTLGERLKDYTAREQEALINQQQAQSDSENVKVIDVAQYARKGRNMRMLMFALATLGWGLTLGLIALMRVFLDPALYVGQTAVRGRRQADRSAGLSDRGLAAAAAVPTAVTVATEKPEVTEAYTESFYEDSVIAEPVDTVTDVVTTTEVPVTVDPEDGPVMWQANPYEVSSEGIDAMAQVENPPPFASSPEYGDDRYNDVYGDVISDDDQTRSSYGETVYIPSEPAAEPEYTGELPEPWTPPTEDDYQSSAPVDVNYNPYAQSDYSGVDTGPIMGGGMQPYIGTLPGSPEG